MKNIVLNLLRAALVMQIAIAQAQIKILEMSECGKRTHGGIGIVYDQYLNVRAQEVIYHDGFPVCDGVAVATWNEAGAVIRIAALGEAQAEAEGRLLVGRAGGWWNYRNVSSARYSANVWGDSAVRFAVTTPVSVDIFLNARVGASLQGTCLRMAAEAKLESSTKELTTTATYPEIGLPPVSGRFTLCPGEYIFSAHAEAMLDTIGICTEPISEEGGRRDHHEGFALASFEMRVIEELASCR